MSEAANGDGGYAGTNVFLAGVDPDRFAATVIEPVDLANLDDLPDALAGLGSVRIGAVASGDRSEQTFERMEVGDLVLCYDEGRYVGAGRVGATVADASWLADAIWDGADVAGGYVLEDFVSFDLPARTVNALFDYSADYSPGDLLRVADGRVDSSLAAIRVAVQRFAERRAA